jgi:pyridoxine kinase
MKRIVSIQDVSCLGKCSQTIALPVISAMGIETSIIPTAVLSTHTMFEGFTFTDLFSDIRPIMDHWKSQDIHFDGIVTGYLGTVKHIDIIADFYDEFSVDGTLKIVDPVFADNGKMYPGFDDEYAKAVASLCAKADYIVPNITEAAIMAGVPYKTDYDAAYINDIIDKLAGSGAKNIIVTSVRRGDENGIIARLADGSSYEYFRPHIDAAFHGTGDLYTSALTGALLRGIDPKKSISLAVDYTRLTLAKTLENETHNWYGVDFEETIPELIKMIDEAFA